MEKEIIEALEVYKPLSILVYGSRGRGDHSDHSDYDIIAIFDDAGYAEAQAACQAISLPGVHIRPYKESEFRDGSFRTPYQKTIFIRGELAEGGRTIYGQKIVEGLAKPKITTLDLIQAIRFQIGYAWVTRISSRNGDSDTTKKGLVKSCLFGLRYLAILKKRQFPVGYEEIYATRHEVVENQRFIRTIEAVYGLRNGRNIAVDDYIFDNIDFLLDVESQIMAEFEANGNRELA